MTEADIIQAWNGHDQSANRARLLREGSSWCYYLPQCSAKFFGDYEAEIETYLIRFDLEIEIEELPHPDVKWTPRQRYRIIATYGDLRTVVEQGPVPAGSYRYQNDTPAQTANTTASRQFPPQ